MEEIYGVLVGVLAALVTALIGWNIYTVIDIRGVKKEIDEKVKTSIEKHIEDFDHTTTASMLQLAGMMHLGLMEKDIKRAFSLFIQAIDELNSANNKVPLDGIVSYIEYLIKDERVYLQDISDDEITRYLNICAKSTRAHELTQLLLSIKSPVLQNNVNV